MLLSIENGRGWWAAGLRCVMSACSCVSVYNCKYLLVLVSTPLWCTYSTRYDWLPPVPSLVSAVWFSAGRIGKSEWYAAMIYSYAPHGYCDRRVMCCVASIALLDRLVVVQCIELNVLYMAITTVRLLFMIPCCC